MTKRSKTLRGLAAHADLLAARAVADVAIAARRSEQNRKRMLDLVRLSSEVASPALCTRISAAMSATASNQQAIDRDMALARENAADARRTSAALSNLADRCRSAERQVEEQRSFEDNILDRIGAACGKPRPG